MHLKRDTLKNIMAINLLYISFLDYVILAHFRKHTMMFKFWVLKKGNEFWILMLTMSILKWGEKDRTFWSTVAERTLGKPQQASIHSRFQTPSAGLKEFRITLKVKSQEKYL